MAACGDFRAQDVMLEADKAKDNFAW